MTCVFKFVTMVIVLIVEIDECCWEIIVSYCLFDGRNIRSSEI